jgi:hypothetical protein
VWALARLRCWRSGEDIAPRPAFSLCRLLFICVAVELSINHVAQHGNHLLGRLSYGKRGGVDFLQGVRILR